MKTLKTILALLGAVVGISHVYLANAEKGPNMAAFADDKKVIVINEQDTSGPNGASGQNTNTFLYSTDYGLTWTYADYPATDANNFCGPETLGHNVYAIKYLQKTFISLGTGGVICTSSDGREWRMAHPSRELITDPTDTILPFYDVAFDGNNNFVAVGSWGLAMYASSPQGPWTPVNYSFNHYDLNSIVYGQGKFVVVGNDANIWYSTDGGQTWTQSTDGPGGHANFEKVIFQPKANNGKGVFIVVGADAYIWYSYDGVAWKSVELSGDPSNTYFVDVTYGNGTYVAVGNDNTAAYAATSEPVKSGGSETWEWVANTDAFYYDGILNHPHAVIYADNQFVAVTANYDPLLQDGYIFTSPDGKVWHKATIRKDGEVVWVNYLATVINTDQGILAIPYGTGDALLDAPAYVVGVDAKNPMQWKALCDLGDGCIKNSPADTSQK